MPAADRTHVVHLRISERTYRQLSRQARKAGLITTAYARALLIAAAEGGSMQFVSTKEPTTKVRNDADQGDNAA